MEKSINLVISETKENIIKVLNESNLPIIVSQMIINEINLAINNQAKEMLQKEKQDYEKLIKEKAKNK